ncbi:hypothetical protein Taro_052235 [Colocasia esculenta]|uniref:Uncharacterized protein n=1 Tax=Colocasia esculenta TaxID=4460 RepID=A0A843XJF7_COLES|nr:hypothetical protein [Colocasia esculenta]
MRLTPLLPSARGSSSQELGVRWVAEAAVAPCVVSSSESECCELLYLSVRFPYMFRVCAAGGLQLLLCRERGECGRSACSCRGGAVGGGLASSGLPCVEDDCRQVQVRCSSSSSVYLGVCVPLWLKGPACGVAFTGAGLLPVELVEGVLALLVVPLLLGAASGFEVCCWFGWCVLVGFPRTVPWWFWWRFSQDRLALLLLAGVFSLMVRVGWSFRFCVLVKVPPRITLCRFWQRFFPGVFCARFGPPLCCPCGSKCAIWLGCILVRFSQDVSGRFWWRFSLKLPCVCFGGRCSLSLYRDELSLLPLCWWDFVCPRGRVVYFVSHALRALADGGMHRVLVLECFDFVLSEASVHCVVPWVALGACESTMCCAVCLIVSFVCRFTTSLSVGGVGLSTFGTLGASLSLVVVPLLRWGGCFALSR